MYSRYSKVSQWENRFDRKAEQFSYRHPCLAFLAVFIGAPVCILLAVGILTLIVAIPLSMLLG